MNQSITYESIRDFPQSETFIRNLIPSIQSNLYEIVKESFPPELRDGIRLVKKIDKGSNNDIYIYQSGDLTIVVRLSKESFFSLNYNRIIVNGYDNNDKIIYLKEAIQSKSNWEHADLLGYTPKLYNYGYLEKNRKFYNYIICEKMDSDLSDYYETGPGKDSIDSGNLSPIDHEIARQLVDLLYATTNKLGIICFDIKPANCMINYSNPDNIVVKLIDWDGDWCQDYSYVTSNRELKDYISILSVMVMAAHFYVFLDWNIFYTYFSNPDAHGNYVREKHNILKSLFCDNLKDSQGNKNSFDFFQKHYFKIMDKHDNPVSCEDAFNITFSRAHFLNRAAKSQATGQHNIGITKVGGKKRNKFVPRRYIPKGLSKRDKKEQREMLKKSRRMYKKGKYFTRKKVKSFKSKKSSHVSKAQKIYKIDKINPSNELANKTGCSVDALKKIVKKGEGAYFSSGSRPNQTAQSWGYARLASAITGGKSAAVDYNILEKGCKTDSEALKLAKKAKRKHGYGKRKTPQVKI